MNNVKNRSKIYLKRVVVNKVANNVQNHSQSHFKTSFSELTH
jgi:hypothetical protein